MPTTLAIESSCDDMSLALVSYNNNTFSVEYMDTYTQTTEHLAYGGVVPEIASRTHHTTVLDQLAKIPPEKVEAIDCIGATATPGLPGSLLIGKTLGALLQAYYNKPCFKINHITGHLSSLFLERSLNDIDFPAAILSVSGGHNDLYIASKKNASNTYGFTVQFDKIGHTRDDAAGEAFDKIARMLGGPFPGGARISEQAANGEIHPDRKFPITLLPDFQRSFSGIKSHVYNLINRTYDGKLTDQLRADIALHTQNAIVTMLSRHAIDAAHAYNCKSIGIVGGVSANRALFDTITTTSGLPTYKPVQHVYSTDNAAMIGSATLLTHMHIIAPSA